MAQAVVMRLAVPPAAHPGGAVPHPVAGGVRSAGAVALDPQRQLATEAAAVLPVSGRAGQELMRLEEQGEARLGHLDAAEFQAAGGVPLARSRPAIAARGAAAARPGVEHVPDEAPGFFMPARIRETPSGILAGDRHAEAAAPAAHGAVRAAMLQGADDGFHDLVRAMAGAHGHRRALPRPDHGALAGDDLE